MCFIDWKIRKVRTLYTRCPPGFANSCISSKSWGYVKTQYGNYTIWRFVRPSLLKKIDYPNAIKSLIFSWTEDVSQLQQAINRLLYSDQDLDFMNLTQRHELDQKRKSANRTMYFDDGGPSASDSAKQGSLFSSLSAHILHCHLWLTNSLPSHLTLQKSIWTSKRRGHWPQGSWDIVRKLCKVCWWYIEQSQAPKQEHQELWKNSWNQLELYQKQVSSFSTTNINGPIRNTLWWYWFLRTSCFHTCTESCKQN